MIVDGLRLAVDVPKATLLSPPHRPRLASDPTYVMHAWMNYVSVKQSALDGAKDREGRAAAAMAAGDGA